MPRAVANGGATRTWQVTDPDGRVAGGHLAAQQTRRVRPEAWIPVAVGRRTRASCAAALRTPTLVPCACATATVLDPRRRPVTSRGVVELPAARRAAAAPLVLAYGAARGLRHAEVRDPARAAAHAPCSPTRRLASRGRG
jgi:hypothetical protein